jgi:hypothetical protein
VDVRLEVTQFKRQLDVGVNRREEENVVSG